MRKINYSEFDLSGFTERELQRICRYYGLEVAPEEARESLIQKILDFSPNELVEHPIQYTPEQYYYDYMASQVIVETPVAKSVRVQRIEECLKKGV